MRAGGTNESNHIPPAQSHWFYLTKALLNMCHWSWWMGCKFEVSFRFTPAKPYLTPTRTPENHIQPGSHTRKVPGRNSIWVMENEKVEKTSIIPSKDSTDSTLAKLHLASTEAASGKCLFVPPARNRIRALIWSSYPHSFGSLMMTGSSVEFHSIPKTCQSRLVRLSGLRVCHQSHLGCDHRGVLCSFFW